MRRWLQQPKTLIIGGIALLVFAGVFWGVWWSYHQVREVVETELTLVQPLNILVMGIDNEAPLPVTDGKPAIGRRTDVLLLMAIRPKSMKVTLLSLPRDSLVEIPGHGVERINAAHVYGGIPLTEQVVQQVTGLKVHRYIQLDFQGFVQLVDLVGGVEVNVDKRMFYEDKSAGLRIDIKKGPQVLRGKDALGYVRFRHDPMGDITRVGRQQLFVQSLLKKVMQPGMLFKATQLYGIARNNIKTDMTFGEITALARFAQGIGGKVEIASHTLPGSFSGPCWKLDPAAIAVLTQPLIIDEKAINAFQEKEKVTTDAN